MSGISKVCPARIIRGGEGGMTKTEAIKKSIRKWESIAEGIGIDRGATNCALCQKYYTNDCIDCPVYHATGDEWCSNTPYGDWINHQKKEHTDTIMQIVATFTTWIFIEKSIVFCPTCREIAWKEVEFLRSLL